jgi:hypothetical protein
MSDNYSAHRRQENRHSRGSPSQHTSDGPSHPRRRRLDEELGGWTFTLSFSDVNSLCHGYLGADRASSRLSSQDHESTSVSHILSVPSIGRLRRNAIQDSTDLSSGSTNLLLQYVLHCSDCLQTLARALLIERQSKYTVRDSVGTG